MREPTQTTLVDGARLIRGAAPERIVPPAPPAPERDTLSLDVWGFADSGFALRDDGVTVMRGERYELSGLELPEFWPWVCEQIGFALDPRDRLASAYPTEIPPARPCAAFLEEVRKFLPEEAISTDAAWRLRHGHGHTQEDMWAIKHGRILRVPDLVVTPRREEDVAAIVEAAARHAVCLIPYGGGTNVIDALRCPEDEARPIASVDCSRLDRILWIDPTNRTACIQAGAVGWKIAAQLADFGFTLGHEPDSNELSTLGGWIATHASGMKKNRYGNIEDLVLDVTAAGAGGEIRHEGVMPRESLGSDPRQQLFGSEGRLGIVTRAVVKLSPLPEEERYDAILFRRFADGVAFAYDLVQSGVLPASVRLVDNGQFQLSQALKPRATGWKRWKRAAEKAYVTRLRGFDPDEMVACTVLHEGSRSEVANERRIVDALRRRHGGLSAGAENGRRGYQMTFGIAYIRDFLMGHHILAESLETSAPWEAVLPIVEHARARVEREHAARGLPGKPFFTARVTQLYPSGAAIYFYFAIYTKGVDDASRVYAELEHAVRDEIMARGGSISHHHGVGKLRGDFLPRTFSKAALAWNDAVKRAVDPEDLFGVRNQRPPR